MKFLTLRVLCENGLAHRFEDACREPTVLVLGFKRSSGRKTKSEGQASAMRSCGFPVTNVEGHARNAFGQEPLLSGRAGGRWTDCTNDERTDSSARELG